MRDEEERADQKAIECKFAYTDLCSLQIQWRLDLQMDCVAMHCNALHSSLSVVPNDDIEMGAEPRECC